MSATLKAPKGANGVAVGGRHYPVVDGFVYDVQLDHVELLSSHGYTVPDPDEEDKPVATKRARQSKGQEAD